MTPSELAKRFAACENDPVFAKIRSRYTLSSPYTYVTSVSCLIDPTIGFSPDDPKLFEPDYSHLPLIYARVRDHWSRRWQSSPSENV